MYKKFKSIFENGIDYAEILLVRISFTFYLYQKIRNRVRHYLYLLDVMTFFVISDGKTPIIAYVYWSYHHYPMVISILS